MKKDEVIQLLQGTWELKKPYTKFIIEGDIIKFIIPGETKNSNFSLSYDQTLLKCTMYITALAIYGGAIEEINKQKLLIRDYPNHVRSLATDGVVYTFHRV